MLSRLPCTRTPLTLYFTKRTFFLISIKRRTTLGVLFNIQLSTVDSTHARDGSADSIYQFHDKHVTCSVYEQKGSCHGQRKLNTWDEISQVACAMCLAFAPQNEFLGKLSDKPIASWLWS